jgi:hypothetical protein
MTCLICMNDAFRGLAMQDKEALALSARDFIQGLILTAAQSSKDIFKSFQPSRRRGICLVERCARVIEVLCGGCQKPDCHRCTISAELRAAEDRINGEREVELAELGFDDKDLEERVDKVVWGLCKEHVAFGSALAGQWYSRQNFLSYPTSRDA